jgi:hypothetical protein
MTAPPPPPGWYPDPSGSGKRRYWDGRTWTHFESLAPQQHHRPKRLVPVLVVGAVLAIIVSSVGNDEKDSASTSSPTSSARLYAPSATAAAPAPPPAPMATIGQEVRDGKFAFVVESVHRSKVAGDPSNPYMTVTPQGEFINVHMIVQNIGDRAQTFFATNQKLIAGGREYEANTMASVWTGGANVNINPGNAIRAVVSFDVPPVRRSLPTVFWSTPTTSAITRCDMPSPER